jgi:hypothetical protein
MGVNMYYLRALIIAAVVATALFMGITMCVDVANAKETTTLEEALERPVVLERRYDNDTGVVCYWANRFPQYIACVQVRDLSPAQHRKLLNDTRD